MSRPEPNTHHDEEAFELTEDGNLLRQESSGERFKYKDGDTIDWLHEESVERQRQQHLRSHRGLRGVIAPLMDASRLWFIIVVTGVGIGLAGAWLDVLVKWLADLREGRCSYGFFYNQVACCSGLDAGEVCTEWRTWSQWWNIHSILGGVLIQIFIYVALAVVFAGSAAILVENYAPYAFHTGIPEIKAILGGYVLDSFLSPWTLLIKALGLALSVASGLSLGKEGPLVHVACCLAYLVSKPFPQFARNEALKRKLLAAAASAGVSVAFGSPLGGVLFGLEEMDTFANESDVMWRGFVTSVIAAVSLQWVDPFGTARLVLFEVTSVSDTWRTFELIPWLALGVIGGVLGSLLIKMNVAVAIFRRDSGLHEWPILEVVGVSAVTAAVSYLGVFTRVQSSELVANLFQECDPTKGDYHGLCNPNAVWENGFLLILTAVTKFLLTAWTFGMMVPAGIFLPTIAIGASLGRVLGLLTQGLQRAYPTAWIFSTCPPDPSVRCVSPGFYAVIGASAMLGGVTRMTISLVVILFELTGALSHVLPIMISVMTAKWVGDAFGKEGIYSVWIAMRRYPWLPPVEYHDEGETAKNIMKPLVDLVVIEDARDTVRDLDALLGKRNFNGFPVVRGQALVGYVSRDKLRSAIDSLESDNHERICSFLPDNTGNTVDLSTILEESVLHLRQDVPQELVVSMFQKMNLRQILLTEGGGKLVGMVSKTDIVALLNRHFPHTGALEEYRGYLAPR
ncbi:hypothetical protein PLICRDRAFT_43156 [Plicaturopsis crispa FD-325 SS-3]|nr:hypothetical protein PLICRDRAFT_43156 [Plicaturopsis crispa FD-325 SS-3]